MAEFDESGDLATKGLILGGTKYMVIQGEPGYVIRGKKVGCLNLCSVPVLTTCLDFILLCLTYKLDT